MGSAGHCARLARRASLRLAHLLGASHQLVATVEEESMTLDELCGFAPAAV